MANAKILNLTRVENEINKRFEKAAYPIILREAAEGAKPLIAEELVESFRRTIFYRTMIGEFGIGSSGDDLQAEFGLTEDTVASALAYIESTLREAFDLVSIASIDQDTGRRSKFGTTNGLIFSINGVVLEDRLRAESFASYISNGYVVPWFDWFLSGGSVADFQITYAVADTNSSRSGRAIMIPVGSSGTEWEFTKGTGTESGDFIDDITKNTEFLQMSRNIIAKEIRSAIKGFSGDIT